MAATTISFRLTALACGLSATLGGLALLGWMLGIPVLTSFVTDGPPMPIPTAVLLLVASIALGLLLLYPRLSELAALFAAGILLLGMLGLAESALNHSFSIQEGMTRLFLAEPGRVAARILPHATLAFALLGAALLLLGHKGSIRSYLAQALALAVVVLGLQTLISMVFNMAGVPAGSSATGMALPAALGFLLLGAGTLLLRSDQGRG